MRYEWEDESCSESKTNDGPKIGFIGQEVAGVYPELWQRTPKATCLSNGCTTAALVEAIKEQQQLIRRQGKILTEALERIAQLETAVTYT